MDWCTWINTIAILVKRDRYSWILYEFTQCSMHHFGREWESIHISLGSTCVWLECGKILCMFGENLFSNNICAMKHSYGIIVKVLIEWTVFAWIYAIRLPDSIHILNVFVRIVSFPLCYYNQHAMTSAFMCLYMSVSNQTTNYGIFTFRNSFFLSTKSWKKVSTCVFSYISYYKFLSQKQIYNVLLHMLLDGMRCLWKKNLSAQVFCNANIHVFRTN